MKKFFMSALAITAVASAAQAGPINLDLRADYSAATYDKGSIPDSNRFNLRTGRVDYQGKAFEDVSFRVRWSFAKNAAQNASDSAQQSLEFAYLTHKMSDMFALTIGRMNTDIGGFEGTTSGSDLYLLSSNYNLYTGQSASGSFTGTAPATYYGTSSMLYMTGAKLTMSFAEGTNSIQLMGMNQKNDEANGSTVDQNQMLMGIVYKGSFMEKTLNFIASYHTSEGPVVDTKYQWMAAGVQWAADPVTISVDYLLNDEKNDAAGAGTKNELSSIVVKAAYTGFEQWVPRLDFFSSERKDEMTVSVVDTKWTGMGAVLEYKPYNDKNFRYHVAYNNIKESPDGAANDITRHEVIVGTRFLGDFLK